MALLFRTFSRAVPYGRVVFKLLVPSFRSDRFLADAVWINICEVQSLIIVSQLSPRFATILRPS